MRLEAIVTEADLVGVLNDLLPVKIKLDGEGSAERWIQLSRPTEAAMFAGEGLRVACPAELKWEIGGVSPTIKFETLSVLLRPDVVEQGHGFSLDFHIELEEVDIRGVPSLIDSAIVKRVNAALAAKPLSWNFSSTLNRTVPIGDTLHPVEALKIEVAWGNRRIEATNLTLVITFKLGFVRSETEPPLKEY